MRDIEFRGKRIDNGEWVTGFYVHYDDTKDNHKDDCDYIVGIHTGEHFPFFEVIPETVGQYTGLDDKCGNKIFEGDIVKHHDFGKTEYTSVVKFGEYEQDGSDGEYAPTECIGFYVEVKSYFVLYYSGDWEPCPYLLQRNLLEVAKSCEVIGNIHDNPELLKEIDKE